MDAVGGCSCDCCWQCARHGRPPADEEVIEVSIDPEAFTYGLDWRAPR